MTQLKLGDKVRQAPNIYSSQNRRERLARVDNGKVIHVGTTFLTVQWQNSISYEDPKNLIQIFSSPKATPARDTREETLSYLRGNRERIVNRIESVNSEIAHHKKGLVNLAAQLAEYDTQIELLSPEQE